MNKTIEALIAKSKKSRSARFRMECFDHALSTRSMQKKMKHKEGYKAWDKACSQLKELWQNLCI